MPNLSREEVLRIAMLARLRLTDEETTFYQQKMGRVLEHIAELNKLNISDGGFVKHVPQDAEAFRDDEPRPYQESTELLKNAPASEARSFLLPKVVEHG